MIKWAKCVKPSAQGLAYGRYPINGKQQPLLYDPGLLRIYLYVCNMRVLVLSPGLKCKRGNACQSAFEGSKDPRGTGSVTPGRDRQGRGSGLWPTRDPAPQERGPTEHRACAVHFAKLSAPWELLVFYSEELSLCPPLQVGRSVVPGKVILGVESSQVLVTLRLSPMLDPTRTPRSCCGACICATNPSAVTSS